MSAGHAHDHGRLAGRDKSNSMLQKNFAHVLELFRGALRDQAHLMFGHRPVRFVIDAANLAAVFRPSHRSPKHDDGAGLRIVVRRRQIERPFNN